MATLSAAVLGTICCDEVHSIGEPPKTGLGGIYYNLITLAQLFNTAGDIYPVVKIGTLDYKNIVEQLKRYPAIHRETVRQYPGRNNQVILNYFSKEERKEYSTCLPKPFTIAELLPIPNVQLYLVNFISGIEMCYRTFQALKKRVKVPLFVDLHSIFMGFKEHGERYYNKNRDWSQWHTSGDIVQMNIKEAGVLAGGSLTDRKSLRQFSRYLLEKGARVILITKGTDGVLTGWKTGSRIYTKDIPAYSFNPLRDPTGCGDVFSSAYIYSYLSGFEPPDAADFASKVAGIRASQKSSEELHNLRLCLLREKII